jgi:hypothetical protein
MQSYILFQFKVYEVLWSQYTVNTGSLFQLRNMLTILEDCFQVDAIQEVIELQA